MPVAPWQNWTSLSSGHVEIPRKSPTKVHVKSYQKSWFQTRLHSVLCVTKRWRHVATAEAAVLADANMTPEPLNRAKKQKDDKSIQKPSQMQAVTTFTKCSHDPQPLSINFFTVLQTRSVASGPASRQNHWEASDVFNLLHLRLSSRANASSAGNCSKVWRIPAIPWAAPK